MKARIHNRLSQSKEAGDALVLAISSIFLVGVMLATLVGVTISTTTRAAVTRAHSQAVAAAEGGIDAVAGQVLNGATCSPSYSSGAGATLSYTVRAEYMPPNGTTYIPCANAVLPPLTKSIRLVGEGAAKAKASSRNTSGNVAKVERVFNRPVQNRFNEAVFGDVYTETNSTYEIEADRGANGTGTPMASDIVTKGRWNCPSNASVSGSVYALGGATTSTNCLVKGDLYVIGKLTVDTKVTVEGDLYVLGDIVTHAGLVVHGDVLATGNLENTTPGMRVDGSMRVKGNFSTTAHNSLASVGRLYLGGVITSTGEFRTQALPKTTENANTSGSEWQLPTIMTQNKTPDDIAKLTFPFIKSTDEMFEGFTRVQWSDFSTEQGIRANGSGPCGGIVLQNKMVVTTNTFIDARHCGQTGITFNDLNGPSAFTIELNADAVLFLNGHFSSSVNVNVVAGPNSSTKHRHTLYIMAARPDSEINPTCDSLQWNTPGIRLNTGTWNTSPQGGRLGTKVMLYSAGDTNLTLTNSGVTSGQVYGCRVLFPSSFSMTYARSGEEQTNTLRDLRTAWMRDLTY